MQVGTLMERGSRKWNEKNAEIENGMFWAVGNRLLGLFLARARGGVYEAKDVVAWCACCRLPAAATLSTRPASTLAAGSGRGAIM